MSVYTVHEPPLRASDSAPDPERFAFVRDGFSFWAFVVPALWMLWHRMWLVLLIYLVTAGGVEVVMYEAGAGTTNIVVQILISLLIGIEAGTLRRFTLARRGWKNVGVVGGANLEEAERRFFDAWVREAPSRRAGPTPRRPAVPPIMPTPQSPEVVGLFPQPGAER